MKFIFRIILFTVIPVLFFTRCEKELPVANLNEPYFTIVDTAFYYALISQGIDKNNDGKISYKEAEAVTNLHTGGQTPNGRHCTDSTMISDYTGIEAFINLEILHCRCGDAVSLDLSDNTNLKFLDCSLNNLTHLDVSGCRDLIELWCTTNSLPLLDVSQNTALKILGCVNNELTNLDISNNTALLQLHCGLNQLTALDISKLTSLSNLYCVQNHLTALDLTSNVDLNFLNIRDNELVSLDLSNNTSLEYLNGDHNYFETLDLSHNTLLNSVYLRDMPSLNDVLVWELPFPPGGVEIDTTGSPNVNFTLNDNL